MGVGKYTTTGDQDLFKAKCLECREPLEKGQPLICEKCLKHDLESDRSLDPRGDFGEQVDGSGTIVDDRI